ncbi:flavin reductase family protein [Oceanobacter mangrovi]|uniref:flavin reductase family protein n=1 Tax=Oceanobacter mangrovi TaxID=2862510 RepID=UPI001C8D6427|nr:flavin reductase family protein [Oceanobacter mangrovi]
MTTQTEQQQAEQQEATQALYKRTLGSFPSGVTVVMAYDSDGKISGLTASAFSALSMNPPLVLVCPQYNSESYQALSQAEYFSINILADNQATEAFAFAKKGDAKQQAINELDIRQGLSGAPVLNNAVATMECARWHEYEGGDHAILIGRIEHMHCNDEQTPMVYCRGSFSALHTPEEALA